MAEVNIDEKDLEKRVISIVEKIKKSRSRPCYQNILTFLTRGEVVITDIQLRVFIDDLLERGVLINKGSAEKESFKVANSVEEDSEDSVVEGEKLHNNIDDIFNITADASLVITSPVDDLINYKFYNILTQRIKDEVVKCVDLKLSGNNITQILRANNDSMNEKESKEETVKFREVESKITDLSKEVKQLKNDIGYLRAEAKLRKPVMLTK